MTGRLINAQRFKAPQTGSLLIEIALVLTISGVLGVVAFGAFSNINKTRDQKKAVSSLIVADQAIRAFALREKRLPCPDTAGTGYESEGVPGSCPAGVQVGELPFNALNIDKPTLPGGGAIKYGVAADLATRPPLNVESVDAKFGQQTRTSPASSSDSTSTSTSTSPSIDADGSERFLTSLAVTASASTTDGQPFVAAADSNGLAVNCISAASYPAYVLAGVNVPGSPLCFSDAPGEEGRVLAIGKAELLGWIQARLQ